MIGDRCFHYHKHSPMRSCDWPELKANFGPSGLGDMHCPPLRCVPIEGDENEAGQWFEEVKEYVDNTK